MHQRTGAVVGQQFEQHGMRHLAVHDDHALDALVERIDAGFDLRIMPPEMVPSAISRRASATDGRKSAPSMNRARRHVGQQQQALGLERAGNGAAKVSALTLKVPPSAEVATAPAPDHLLAEHVIEHGEIDLVRLADEARSTICSMCESGSITVR